MSHVLDRLFCRPLLSLSVVRTGTSMGNVCLSTPWGCRARSCAQPVPHSGWTNKLCGTSPWCGAAVSSLAFSVVLHPRVFQPISSLPPSLPPVSRSVDLYWSHSTLTSTKIVVLLRSGCFLRILLSISPQSTPSQEQTNASDHHQQMCEMNKSFHRWFSTIIKRVDRIKMNLGRYVCRTQQSPRLIEHKVRHASIIINT